MHKYFPFFLQNKVFNSFENNLKVNCKENLRILHQTLFMSCVFLIDKQFFGAKMSSLIFGSQFRPCWNFEIMITKQEYG